MNSEKKEAFEDKLAAVYPSLRNFARMRTSAWHDADDLVQATIERCLARKLQFKIGTNLQAWAITVMRNIHLDGLKKKTEVQLDDDLPEATDMGSAEATVELSEVHQILLPLPLTQREVLILKAEGYTSGKIAELLGIPAGTARRRLYDGRMALTRVLNGEDDGRS